VVEELVDFLQMGFQQKPAAPWLDIGKRKKESFPVIIRRRTLYLSLSLLMSREESYGCVSVH
jgi:hypothetical protein